MPTVDLVYDTECPNVDDARALIRAALAQAGLPSRWREWQREAPETPVALRGLGSPTILVNGVDVTGSDDASMPEEPANCCRIYQHEGRLRGVPALSAISAAISSRQGAT
jgi:hypothetical protein